MLRFLLHIWRNVYVCMCVCVYDVRDAKAVDDCYHDCYKSRTSVAPGKARSDRGLRAPPRLAKPSLLSAPRMGEPASARLPLSGSASLQPLIIDSLFADAVNGVQAPPAPSRVIVSLPEARRDASGKQFFSYPLRVQLENGGMLRTERRYTEFAALQEEVHVALALPAAFPVPQVQVPIWMGGTAREELLQQYLDRLLDEGAKRAPALPAVTAFCRLAPYVAAGSPATTCLAALPTAAPAQCLAMMRAHATSEVMLAAGARRLLELVRGDGEGASSAALLLDAGAIEFLCCTLRRLANATGWWNPPTTSAASRVQTLLLAGRADVAADTSSAPSANAVTPPVGSLTTAADVVSRALKPSNPTTGASGGSGTAPYGSQLAAASPAPEPLFAGDAVGVLAALATDPTSRPEEARTLLRRCGTAELLTSLMAAHPASHATQAGCAALIAALVAADRASPPGMASHYDFEAVELICRAMRLHRSRLEMQWKGCAALHALACRATALAEAVVLHDGVRLVCKAMSTYRSEAAARLQASACGAIAALADHVTACRPALRDYSAAPLIGQTVADFASANDGGAAVFVCGVRALLTLSDLPPSSEALLGPSGLSGTLKLEELMWSAAQRHSARPVVQGVCCEAIAAVTRERLRLAAAGALDLLGLHRAGTVPRAARFVSSALYASSLYASSQGRHAADAAAAEAHRLELACPALSAAQTLVQLHMVGCEAGCGGDTACASSQLDDPPPPSSLTLVPASDLGSLEMHVQRLLAADDDPTVRYLGAAALEAFAAWRGRDPGRLMSRVTE